MERGNLLLEGRGLTRVYGRGVTRVLALDSVDLAIGHRDFTAVMGPSGCGKTTLLNCLSGLDEPTTGNVLLEGKMLSGLRDSERTRLRASKVGFVFQALNLLAVFSAIENVELPLLLSGTPARAARMQALKSLDDVGLGPRSRHRPSELSGGEQQRVAIARAIVHRPAVVFADEPTGNLDAESSDGILHLLQELNDREGMAVLIVTHDRGVASSADRVVEMRDGRIVR